MKTIKFSIVLLVLTVTTLLVQAQSFTASIKPSVQDTLVAIQHPRLADYKVLESGALVIYERHRPGNKLNLFKPVVTHYFSVKGSVKIYSLTIENLKRVYRDGPGFATVDAYFGTDDDLLTYDRIHHKFRVNYYLSEASAQHTRN